VFSKLEALRSGKILRDGFIHRVVNMTSGMTLSRLRSQRERCRSHHRPEVRASFIYVTIATSNTEKW